VGQGLLAQGNPNNKSCQRGWSHYEARTSGQFQAVRRIANHFR
jgi:hypothetical protein